MQTQKLNLRVVNDMQKAGILIHNMEAALNTPKKRQKFLHKAGWRLMGVNIKSDRRAAYYANLEIEGVGARTFCQADAISITCWNILCEKGILANEIEFRIERGRVHVNVPEPRRDRRPRDLRMAA